jgi:hypothetical protein
MEPICGERSNHLSCTGAVSRSRLMRADARPLGHLEIGPLRERRSLFGPMRALQPCNRMELARTHGFLKYTPREARNIQRSIAAFT